MRKILSRLREAKGDWKDVVSRVDQKHDFGGIEGRKNTAYAKLVRRWGLQSRGVQRDGGQDFDTFLTKSRRVVTLLYIDSTKKVYYVVPYGEEDSTIGRRSFRGLDTLDQQDKYLR